VFGAPRDRLPDGTNIADVAVAVDLFEPDQARMEGEPVNYQALYQELAENLRRILRDEGVFLVKSKVASSFDIEEEGLRIKSFIEAFTQSGFQLVFLADGQGYAFINQKPGSTSRPGNPGTGSNIVSIKDRGAQRPGRSAPPSGSAERGQVRQFAPAISPAVLNMSDSPGGVGMHPIGSSRDFNQAEAREMSDLAMKRDDIEYVGPEERAQFAARLNALANQQIHLFTQFPTFPDELRALADFLIKKNQEIKIGSRSYKVRIHRIPESSPSYTTTWTHYQTSGFTFKDDDTGILHVYVQDIASVIGEGLEHITFATPHPPQDRQKLREGRSTWRRYNRVLAVRNDLRERHTYAFFGEAAAGSIEKTIEVEGHQVPISVPRRAIFEIRNKSQGERRSFIRDYQVLIDGQSSVQREIKRKFKGYDRDRLYALAMAKELNRIAVETQALHDTPDDSDSGASQFGLAIAGAGSGLSLDKLPSLSAQTDVPSALAAGFDLKIDFSSFGEFIPYILIGLTAALIVIRFNQSQRKKQLHEKQLKDAVSASVQSVKAAPSNPYLSYTRTLISKFLDDSDERIAEMTRRELFNAVLRAA
jgi:hypothetical protein